MDITKVLEYDIFTIGTYTLTVYMVIQLILVFVLAKILLLGVKKIIDKRWNFKELDQGSKYAVMLIIKYFVWSVTVVLALESVGIKVTLILAGSAALLVGLGLGLQQTFNDIVSGIILLIEGSTKVDDVLEVDGDIVIVKSIGIRASKVVNRNDIFIIIPNSLIVTNKVINWSHQIQETRFKISVGVAYGSDVDKVIDILEQSVSEHTLCSKKKKPEARFISFGDSSLDFEVFFWSKEMFRVDRMKSDVLRVINNRFIENQIVIPFPQRDVHIKTN